jgi:hypothetical protein
VYDCLREQLGGISPPDCKAHVTSLAAAAFKDNRLDATFQQVCT